MGVAMIKINISKQFLLSLIGIITVFTILFLNDLSAKMVGFWGSIIGGIIGGLFTYLGVRDTIRNERIASYGNNLKSILPLLLDMEKQVDDNYKELRKFNDILINTDFSGTISGRVLGEPLEGYQLHTKNLEFRLLQSCIVIDANTYTGVATTMSSIEDRFGWVIAILRGHVVFSEKPIHVETELRKFINETSADLDKLKKFLAEKRIDYNKEYLTLKETYKI
jgi:hypothetical protein